MTGEPNNWLSGRDHVPLRDGFDLGWGQCREVCRFCGEHVPRYVVVVCFQVFRKVIDCAAFAGTVSDENDLVSGQEVLCNLFVEGLVFRHPFALVVCFLLVDQVMVEAEGVVGPHSLFRLGEFPIEVLVYVCDVVIHNDHHPAGLRRLPGWELWSGIPEKLTQPGDFFDTEFVSLRMLEERSLCADGEDKLIVAVGMHFADLSDQFYGVSPTQISRQLAREEARVE